MNCKNCKKQGCSLAGKNHEMSFECKAYIGKTNADRIRAMTDEELALFIHNSEAQAVDTGRADTVESWLDWLKQEASE